MTILGLDLSLTATGWCQQLKPWTGSWFVDFGTIRPSSMSEVKRLSWLSSELAERIDASNSELTLAVVESPSYGSKSATFLQIGWLHWQARILLDKAEIPYVLVAPVQLKQFATGSTKADKALILREVWRRWKIEAADNNQADAVVLAQIGRALLGELDGLTEFQKKVLSRIAKKHRKELKAFAGAG